jgi:hypothetical protein
MKINEEIQYFLIARNHKEMIYKISSNNFDDLKSKMKTFKKKVEEYELKIPIEGKSGDVFVTPEIDKVQGEV